MPLTSIYALKDFDLEYLDDNGQWQKVPGGQIRGNNLVFDEIVINPPIDTTAIRVLVLSSQDNNLYSRIAQLEAIATDNAAPGSSLDFTFTDMVQTAGDHTYQIEAIDNDPNQPLTNLSATVSVHVINPLPDVSPNDTKGITIVDTQHQTWSLGASVTGGQQTLRDGVWVGGGGGIEYALHNGDVYLRNNAGHWYLWNGTWNDTGTTDPTAGQPPAVHVLRNEFSEAQLQSGASTDVTKYLTQSASAIVTDWGATSGDFLNGQVGEKIAARLALPNYFGLDFTQFVSGTWTNPADQSSYVNSQTVVDLKYPLPTVQQKQWYSFPIMVDPDVKTGMSDQIIKLPGLASTANGSDLTANNGGFQIRLALGPPNFATNPVSYQASALEFRPDAVGSTPQTISLSGMVLQEGVLHTIDLGLTMNTFVNPTSPSATLAGANADGEREIWLDDVMIRHDTNVKWRTNPQAGIAHVLNNIFHGGVQVPRSPIHFWLGPAILSKTSRPGKLHIQTDPGSIWVPEAPYGYMDKPSATRVSGWVVDRNHPEKNNIKVNLYINGQPHGPDIIANDPSPDVIGAGFGNGNNRFHLDFDELPVGVYSFDILVNGASMFPGPAVTRSVEVIGAPDLPKPPTVVVLPPEPSITILDGPLLGLPAAMTGPHLAIIDSLGARQWARLPLPVQDPVYGPSLGKSWGPKMPFSEALGAAWLHGQGNHGAEHFTGGHTHYDDMFVLDTHRWKWICVYPGINCDTFAADIQAGRIALNPATNRLEYTDTNELHKPGWHVWAAGSHTYAWPHFDYRDGVFVGVNGWPQGRGGDQFKTPGGGGWYTDGYNVMPVKTQGGSGVVYYDPIHHMLGNDDDASRRYAGQYFLRRINKTFETYGGVTTLDGVAMNPTGRVLGTFGVGDFGSCVDQRRARVYCGVPPGGYPYSQVYVYDAINNEWHRPTYDHPTAMFPPNEAGIAHFDEAADKVITFHNPTESNPILVVSVWNPITYLWEGTDISPVTKGGATTGFYWPAKNVHIIYNANDDSQGDGFWAYRHVTG